jgi:hypothetical protein
MSIETLDQTAVSIKKVAWAGSKLRAEFGGGYGAAAIVGAASGLHRFTISMSVLPTATANVGQISSQTWFAYYYAFFIARTTGGEETFYITWNSKTWHVKFADVHIDFDRFVGDIYSTGIDLRQVRVTGTTYASDGSITP